MKNKGSVFGGILLIAGSCIGAGMLALPILTGMAGFFPTLLMFIIAFILMTTTGLLLVEVQGWFQEETNLLSIVGKTLGPVFKGMSLTLYLFLFYALITAYIAGSGVHTAALFSVSPFWGSLFFTLLFGSLVYFGTYPVDLCNRFLMLGKMGAYVGLVLVCVPHIDVNQLFYNDAKYSFFALPILVISFGFHNMIPSLMHYMNGDKKKVRNAILGGSFLALAIYLIWEVVALSILPLNGIGGILTSYHKGIDAAESLKMHLASHFVGSFAALLAFFAILTSFLAQSLSLVHFLRDGFRMKKGKREPLALCLLALVPPLIFALKDPTIFFHALNFAGGVCAVILFGFFPVFMVWVGRYRKGKASPDQTFGGKKLLVIVFLFSLLIISYQVAHMCGLSLIPTP